MVNIEIKHPDQEVEDIRNIMGKTIYVDFPHEVEAKVIGVLTKQHLTSTPELLEEKEFKSLENTDPKTLFPIF